jgi:HlyD family secretion protein
MTRKMKRGIVLLITAGILAFALSMVLRSGNSTSVAFRTAPVQRGDLQATISATGTVEPEEVVDVGAQVAGRIVSFGKDQAGKTVDYGSVVEEGMILAQIDDSLYAADVAQTRAQLEQARAGVKRAEADLGQMQAKLVQAERDWIRAKKLGPSDALSQADFDAALSANDSAKANVEVGKASIIQAKNAVNQAQASLNRSQQNLDYCTIRSPVRGVIIDRRVNIGQTVVASLNAPSLFLIAKDLKRMQVWVAVNEADIGNIQPGQPVTFTADAYPGQVFQGEVGKVRLNATMTQNVVNYTVEVITDNSSGKLLPYLTANVKFLLSSRRDVLMVPNMALRWSPQQEHVDPEGRKPDKPKARPASAEAIPPGYSRGVVWVPRDSFVKPSTVIVGVSDGSMTEIQGEGIQEGTLVVLGEQPKENGNTPGTTSPFTPQLFRGGGGRR